MSDIISKIPRRMEVIEKFKSTGGQIAAVYPYHYHKALFRAFNILPVEVWGPPGIDTSYGGAYLQPYVCSIVHSGLSFYAQGKLEVAEYLVVPHMCDSLQGLGSVYIDFIKPRQKVFTIYLPRGRKDLDIEFLASEFKAIYDGVAEATGKKPSEEEILEKIYLEEKAVEKQKELYQRRKNLTLGNYEFYKVLRSREFLPAEDFIELVDYVIDNYYSEQESDLTPVIFSGLVPEPMEVLEKLDEFDALLMADDFACCGRRLYPPGESKDPFIRMAESILNEGPDSARGSSVDERFQHLKALVDDTGAKGIVFYIVKFCEMELFYTPHLTKELKSAGISTTYIEVDINDTLPDQTVTRLEAFLEVL